MSFIKTGLCKTKLRCFLAILLIAILAFGSYMGYLFLHPVKPEITKETGLNCQRVQVCSKDCSSKCPSGFKKMPCMFNCNKRCRHQTCESAKQPNEELSSCIKRHCLVTCLQNQGPECEKCASANCKKQQIACQENRCK